MFSEQNRFLVVAAHPDDEVLSIGGILARARDANIEVAVQFLGEGISARFDPEDFGNDDYERAMKTRMDGAKAALDLLGIDKVRFENQYCCRFDRFDILDLVKMVELQIADFNPTHIFTHNPVEVNIDHRITYRVVETATRPKPGLALREVYSFEIPCSGSWTFDDSFKPNFYVDVKEVWDQKIAAWNCYEGEERVFPFPRSVEGLETMAQYRGMQAGLECAEGLRLLRGVVTSN